MNSRFDYSFIDPSMYANVFLKWARYDMEKAKKIGFYSYVAVIALCALGLIVFGVICALLFGTGWEYMLIPLLLALLTLLLLTVRDLRGPAQGARTKGGTGAALSASRDGRGLPQAMGGKGKRRAKVP